MPRIFGVAQMANPAAVADGVSAHTREDRYGSLFLPIVNKVVNSEGLYYRATNPTFGTPIALSSPTRTTFLATECCTLMRNTSASATGPTVYPDFLRYSITAVATGSTSVQMGIIIDTANRFSSGGSAVTEVQANTAFTSPGAVAELFIGNTTALAAVAPRQINRFTVATKATPALAIGDVILLTFGDAEGASNGSVSGSPSVTPTGATQYVIPCGPIGLGPNGNHSMLVHYWAPGQSAAPSFEFDAGWWER